MNKLMYYPTILIPSTWLKKAIFLSDEISSIYPYGFSPSLDGQQDKSAFIDMEYLRSEGLYSYSRPEDLTRGVYKSILKDLSEQLNPELLVEVRENFKSNSTRYEIFKSKMDYDIINFLIDNKIAKDFDQNQSILVEETTAMIYMSILACYSAINKKHFTTATNSNVNMKYLFDKSSKLANDYFIEIILENVPQPNDNCSLDDVIKFKKRNQRELLNYRLFLSDWFTRISKDNSSNSVNAFSDDIKRYNIELEKIAKSSKFSFIRGSLEVLIPVITQVVTKSLLGDIDTNDLIETGATTISSIGIKKIKTAVKNTEVINGNPLNYLLNASNEQIIGPSSNTQSSQLRPRRL